MEVLGKRLKWLREKERYSQKDIAKKIGMTASGYQKIEYGERDPKLDVLVSLCGIFGVSADFLLGRHNYTKELEELSMEIEMARIQLDRNQMELSEITHRINHLQDDITSFNLSIQANVNNEGAARDSVNSRQKSLSEYISVKAKVEHEIYQLSKQFSNTLLEYISILVDLPASIPSKDRTLLKFLPINIEIQPDIFDRFALQLYGKRVGFIGNYGDYETMEEIEMDRMKLLALLNGE